MATRRSHRQTQDVTEQETTPETHEFNREEVAAQTGTTAGAAREEGDGAPPKPSQRPVMERAEELADHLGDRVGHFASLIGYKIMQWTARAREELEDIWAEAQRIRRGNKPPQP